MCAFNRSPNLQHPSSRDTERTVSLLESNYGFLKTAANKYAATWSVTRLHTYRVCSACLDSHTGRHQLVIGQVAGSIDRSCLCIPTANAIAKPLRRLWSKQAIAHTGRTGKRVCIDEPTGERSFPFATDDGDDIHTDSLLKHPPPVAVQNVNDLEKAR